MKVIRNRSWPKQELFLRVRAEEYRLSRALVSGSALSFALAFAITCYPLWSFNQISTSGIVSWVSVHNYSKANELLNYALALVGTPVVIMAFWFLWFRIAEFIASETARSVSALLRPTALAFSPLLLFWLALAAGKHSAIYLLLLPSIFTALAFAVIYFRHKTSPERTQRFKAPQSAQISGKPKELQSVAPKAFPVALKFIVIPLLLYFSLLPRSIDGMLDLYHEGELFAPLNQLQSGGVPYRDIYVQHGLFTNIAYPKIGSFLFGDTLEGVRRFQNLLHPLPYIAFYFLSLTLFQCGLLMSLAAVFLSSGVQYWISPRKTFALLALTLLCAWINGNCNWNAVPANTKRRAQRRDQLYLVLAGVLTGLAFWRSTEIGIYLFATSICFFCALLVFDSKIERRQKLSLVASYILGGAVVIGLGLVYLLTIGAVPRFMLNVEEQLFTQAEAWGLPYFTLKDALAPLAAGEFKSFLKSEGLRWYLPVLTALVAETFLIHSFCSGALRWSKLSAKFLLLLLSSLIFFRTALGRSDLGHLVDGQTFFVLLILFPLDFIIAKHLFSKKALFKEQLRSLSIASAGIFLVLAFAFYIHKIHNPTLAWRHRFERILVNPFSSTSAQQMFYRSGRAQVPPAQALQIEEVCTYVVTQSARNEPIFDFSNNGAYYFLCDRPSASRFQFVAYAAKPEAQLELIAALESQQVRVVIYKTGSVFDAIDGIPNDERHQIVAEYIKKHFRPAKVVNGTHIYLRN